MKKNTSSGIIMSEEQKKQDNPVPQVSQRQFLPTGDKLTADQMKFGYWIITHKLLLRRIGILVLVAFNILLFVYIVYGLLNYYVISRGAVQSMYNDLTSDKLNYSYIEEMSQPIPLSIANVYVLRNDGENVDLMAEVNNTNLTWYVPEIKYHFESGDFKTKIKTDYVLPLQQKFLMNLSVKNNELREAVLVIDEIKWQKQAYFEQMRDNLFQIEVTDEKFVSATTSGVSDSLKVSRVEFTAKNQSAYNYWDTKFKVLLYRGNKLVYINEVPVRTFNSEEVKDIKFNIFESINKPDKVYVFPDVNFLDEDSFKAFEG